MKIFILLKAKVWKSNIFPKLENLTNLHKHETFYNVVKEINQFSQNVHSIEENLKHVTFNVLDECKRNHFIKIYIPEEYSLLNQQQLVFETELPLAAQNSLLMVNNLFYFIKNRRLDQNEVKSIKNFNMLAFEFCVNYSPIKSKVFCV